MKWLKANMGFAASPKTMLLLSLLIALVVSLQSWYQPEQAVHEGGKAYTAYNNYVIFQKSFDHLIEGKDLYLAYPDEYWDLYKYSPTFAAIFGCLAILPDFLGLYLWNLLNIALLCFAILKLPKLRPERKSIVFLIILVELITSLQSEQSNGLISGLLMMGFLSLEKSKNSRAIVYFMAASFIKLFAIVFFLIFIFYPRKQQNALRFLLWFLVFSALPLIFISPDQYWFLLQSYWVQLTDDHQQSFGLSVMGMANAMLPVSVNKIAIVFAGLFIQLIPLIQLKNHSHFFFKLLFFSSLLLWVVLFNHKAESPTFIIAITGVAVSFAYHPNQIIDKALILFILIFSSLSPTDIFPEQVRKSLINPYALRAFPYFLYWLRVLYLLFKPTIYDDSPEAQT